LLHKRVVSSSSLLKLGGGEAHFKDYSPSDGKISLSDISLVKEHVPNF
jgi:hypothetical protein